MTHQLELNVVPQAQWQVAIDDIRKEEKALMHAQDMLSAKRRRLPVVAITKPYEFDGPDGKVSLLELFDGRSQLIVYNFMYGPGSKPCVGCSCMVDNMGHQAHLQARDTSRVLISRARIQHLLEFRECMGWQIPWYSSYDSDFNQDFGTTTSQGEMFALNVFIRQGEAIYRSYCTTRRGVEPLASHWSFLDLTPLGRQENWEDSPAGVAQTEPYSWWRYHDDYDAQQGASTCVQPV